MKIAYCLNPLHWWCRSFRGWHYIGPIAIRLESKPKTTKKT